MNYRHIYHAGNVCDVVKHSVLALLLDYMATKDKPFAVMDTHAGCGHYDLQDERALKTCEADAGVKKLWTALQGREIPTLLATYWQILTRMNADGAMRFYPGSPLLTAHKLREQDRLIACELHPEDVQPLRRALRPMPLAHVHHRDGYEALGALLPFAEKRGLILIDPPFETPNEFAQLVAAMQRIHARMPSAVVAVWLPIKDRAALWRFYEALAESGVPKLIKAEFMFLPELRGDRLNGTGFVFMNPPWTLEAQLRELFPLLHDLLETETRDFTIGALS